MFLQQVTLQASYLLVPKLLAVLHSPAPCCQGLLWGHCYSFGLAHTGGSCTFSALHAAFHEQCFFFMRSSVAAATVACEGFANIG